MKRIVTILLFFISGSVSAQKYQDYVLDKVRIVEPDKIIQAELIPITTEPGIKSDRFYYWYSSNKIHFSQGGFSGKLLNGVYYEYYLNKNLKEQGNFKKGLKNGTWKSWNEDGTLSPVSVWKNGVIVRKNPHSFWKKVNIFKRKSKQSTADTLKKTSK
jgi:antitoxin component YwqK of YwqJK toxin-antitoxin module